MATIKEIMKRFKKSRETGNEADRWAASFPTISADTTGIRPKRGVPGKTREARKENIKGE